MTETQGFINTLKLIIIKEIIQAMKNKQIKFKIFIKKNYIRNKKLRQIVRRSINIKLKKALILTNNQFQNLNHIQNRIFYLAYQKGL